MVAVARNDNFVYPKLAAIELKGIPIIVLFLEFIHPVSYDNQDGNNDKTNSPSSNIQPYLFPFCMFALYRIRYTDRI